MARIFVLLLIILVIVGLFWALRRQSRGGTGLRNKLLARPAGGGSTAAPKPGGLEKLRDNPMFWGVEMAQPGCEAAHELLGRQFPFDEVPELPLEGCNSANCTCQFKGLTDRRKMVRRQQQDRRATLRFDKDRPERRSRKDRRRGNAWIDHDY
ncbi:MAG TPA: hypothetical protein VET88_06775 [Gammaproteobacteria bacterium]|nr:hypothetical protein [Gammaproteobacteria bacterium]